LILVRLFDLQGEDICVAAVREVKEETGVSALRVIFYSGKEECIFANKIMSFQIDSEFIEIVAFRYLHYNL